MGFEVRYKYHEKLDDGGYNKEETLEMTKKVGDAYDDISLEKLASVIMSQLARRDIWVVDFEAFEFKKAKITCKDTKGGLIIKNKKFNFDGTSVVVTDEAPAAPPVQPGQHPHERVQPEVQTGEQPHNTGPRRAIKWVILDTDLPTLLKIKQNGLKFSENKKYPVFSERPNLRLGSSMYVMKDDLEREVTVSSEYFLPANVQLIEDKEGSFSRNHSREPSPKLLYEDKMSSGMPDLAQIKRGGQRAVAAARQAMAASDPQQASLQRAAAMRAMMEGRLPSDAGGQPTEMLDVRRGRNRRDDLAGVSADMAAIVAQSEIKTRESAPQPKRVRGKGKGRQAPVPINPPSDVDLPFEDEAEAR